MPISLPNLDDRTYTDLVTEAQAMIPTVYPAWTNHNPSDPGMVLIEMLAWLTEMALFQVNEITDKHIEAFLELLNGPAWELSAVGDLDTAIGQTVLALRDRYRAVTRDDFEYLIFNNWPQTSTAQALGTAGEVARICYLPQRDLTADDPTAEAPGHVSLVILPQPENESDEAREPTTELLEGLWTFLDPRRLLTVRHHVVKPTYVPVKVQARIYIWEDVPIDTALDIIDGPEVGLSAFFDPHTGGVDTTGWPFGRGVYVSEIYAFLSQLAVVDYVDDVTVSGPDGQPSSVSVELDAHQLVDIDLSGLVLVDIYGNERSVENL
jgi:hypothetical protein